MPPLIRLATLADARQIQAIYGPYCHTPISFEMEPPSVEEMGNRLAKVLPQYPWLVGDDGGQVLGYVHASQHRERAAYRWSVDTTIYIRQESHRLGLGRALYTALLTALPLLGYVNAYAGVTLPNEGSVGLHEALGFQSLGVYKHVGFKYGAWHDVVWLQRLLQPLPIDPAPLKSLQEILPTPGWAEAVSAGQRLLIR